MPDWNQLLVELQKAGGAHDVLRRKYLAELQQLTKRNVIIYYSGWLQKPELKGTEVNDADKNGLMTVIHGLDKSLGLDLVLHTPGGEVGATESLVDYLRSIFGTNIRAIIPQLAMSAGTMMACACKEIIMGKQSSLGPIDPQFRGIPAHGVVEEFSRARDEISKSPSAIPLWQPIIAKYAPTFIGECEKAVIWANEIVRDWLVSGMFEGLKSADKRATKVLNELADHGITKSHARHLSYNRCKEIGLKVRRLEQSSRLQDAVLTVHHACVHTLGATAAFKIIENHKGTAFIQMAKTVIVKT